MKGISALLSALVFTAVVLYFPAYFWVFPYLHDRTLQDFSSRFMSISLPDKTQEIDKLTRVGQQSGGNINECDYLAAFLLKTELPRIELEKHYSSHYRGKSEVEFYWLNEAHGSGIGEINPTGIPTFTDWLNSKSKGTGANVIVYIMEPALTSSIDPRCSGPFGI
jgi:hypothetical protein